MEKRKYITDASSDAVLLIPWSWQQWRCQAIHLPISHIKIRYRVINWQPLFQAKHKKNDMMPATISWCQCVMLAKIGDILLIIYTSHTSKLNKWLLINLCFCFKQHLWKCWCCAADADNNTMTLMQTLMPKCWGCGTGNGRVKMHFIAYHKQLPNYSYFCFEQCKKCYKCCETDYDINAMMVML